MATGVRMERIGNYSVDTSEISELGKGAWGIVYPAYRGRDKLAAKKVTVETELINPEVFKEADVLMKTVPRHEYIIQVHDFLRTNIIKNSIPHTNFWLIMDYCESRNLKTFARNTDLSMYEKMEIMLFCMRGLQHLHDNQVVHRDIKPENILVGSSHKEIKLSDFGTARTVDLLHGQSVTLSTLAGTMDYMAPELYSLVVDGDEPTYDKSVDIFSMGMCFYALLHAVKGRTMRTFKVNGQELGRVMWQKRNKAFKPAMYNPDDENTTAMTKMITKMLRMKREERWKAWDVWNHLMCMFEGNPREMECVINEMDLW